jgi:hypothetical protein
MEEQGGQKGRRPSSQPTVVAAGEAAQRPVLGAAPRPDAATTDGALVAVPYRTRRRQGIAGVAGVLKA